jgi:ABC-2 type transport system permease protein
MTANERHGRTPNRPTGVRAAACRELGRIYSQSSRYALLMLVLPLISFGLSWGLFFNQYPRDLPVAVVDLDHSSLSRQLSRLVDSAASMKVAYQPADPAAAKNLLLCGQAYAVVIMPRGLERDIKSGLGGDVVGYYNAQMLLPGSIVSSSLNAIVTTVSAGVNFQSRQRRGEMGDAARIHLEPVNLDRHVLFNPQLNYLTFLATALCPTFLHLFVIMTSVLAMGEELKNGTARQWLDAAGGSVWRAIAGKWLVHFIAFGLMGLVMLAVILKGFGVPLRGSLVSLVAATILLILADQACGLLLLVLNPSLRMALSATSFYAGTAFAFVGLTFPQAGMPALAKAWSNLLPLTHYLHVFLEQTVRGAALADSVPDMLLLCGFVLLGLFLTPLFKRYMTDSRYWGRP